MFLNAFEHASATNFRGLQSLFGESHCILVVLDNVDLLASQLADDRLHPHTLHANTSAHSIHVFVFRHDGNLGAFAGLAGNRPDDHGSVVNFRHFRLEQMLHSSGAARDTTTAGPFEALSTRAITTRTRSPMAKDSNRDCSLRGMRDSALPRSKITSGPSIRFTVAFTISFTRPMYSL